MIFRLVRVQTYLEKAGTYDVVWTLVGPCAAQVTKYDEALAVDVVTDCQEGVQGTGHHYLQQQMPNLGRFHSSQAPNPPLLCSRLMKAVHLPHRY